MCTHMLQTRVTECLMPQQQQWQNIWQDLGTFLLFALNAICREWRECDTRQQTNPQISTIQRIVVLKVDIQVPDEPDKSSGLLVVSFSHPSQNANLIVLSSLSLSAHTLPTQLAPGWMTTLPGWPQVEIHPAVALTASLGPSVQPPVSQTSLFVPPVDSDC